MTGDGHWFYIKEMIDLGIDIWKVDIFSRISTSASKITPPSKLPQDYYYHPSLNLYFLRCLKWKPTSCRVTDNLVETLHKVDVYSFYGEINQYIFISHCLVEMKSWVTISQIHFSPAFSDQGHFNCCSRRLTYPLKWLVA